MERQGHLSHRRRTGGRTLYPDCMILDRDGGLSFKGDTVSDAAREEAGCERFGHDQDGKRATMNDRYVLERRT